MRGFRPSIPKAVVRELRQESGFGCAVCGHPIVEYHHIIPWAERQHFEPEHMVALCRNHHKELGDRSRKHAYRAKQNPINIRTGRVKGYLYTNKENQALVIGNTRFVGATHAVSYFGNPLFGYRIADSEIQINAFIPDDDLWPSIEVKRNEVTAAAGDFWDIEFKNLFVKFQRKKGENFLSIDMRKDDVEVRGHFTIHGNEFLFSPKRSDFGGPRIENLTLEMPNGGTAIAHGGNQRLLRPNFAMRVPRAIWL